MNNEVTQTAIWNLLFPVNFVVGSPHLRDIFYRMGLSDKDIVALSGGHTLVILSSCFHLYIVFFCNRNERSPHFVCCLLCYYREGHIQKDRVLMVLGPRNL